jgi:hypothetical protein
MRAYLAVAWDQRDTPEDFSCAMAGGGTREQRRLGEAA